MRKAFLLLSILIIMFIFTGCFSPGTKPISSIAISGVTVPVKGATPVSAVTGTAEYTGTVSWNGNPTTFAPSVVYTATITLTPKPGYTTNGIPANFFTVAGATTVTNAANSGVITAVFPATAADPDSTAPVPGNSGAITVSNLAATTLTLNWAKATDSVSAQSALQYKVVKAATSTAIDSITEVDAITGADLLLNWTADINTLNVTGLTDNTIYYFNIAVKDEAGNIAIYTVKQQGTTEITPPVPGNSGTITVTNLAATTLTLNWTKATDSVSPQSSLQYKVVKATASAAIDSITEVDAITGVNLLQDWAADINTLNVTGLTSQTTYFFNIAVKDEAGNIAIYTVKQQATPDVTSPAPGNSGTISTANITGTKLTLNWTKATDSVSVQSALQYKVVKATTSAAIDTVGEVDAITGADLLQDWTANINTLNVTGLSGLTSYYFNILVKDEAGNKAVYSPVSATTLAYDFIGSAGFTADTGTEQGLTVYNGTPYIAFRDGANSNKLTVMKYNGSSWVTVGSAGISADAVFDTKIAVNNENDIYVAYLDSTAHAVVLNYNGTSWTTLPSISSGTLYRLNLSLNSGTPYVGFRDDASSYKPTVKYYNGSSWVTIGTPTGYCSGALKMFLDGTTPYIVYEDGSNGQKLSVIRYNGSSWVTVGNVGFSESRCQTYASIYVNSGTPYVAYVDQNSSSLKLVKLIGSTWTSIDTSSLAGSASEVTLKFIGSTPYIVYASSYRTKLVRYNGTSWDLLINTNIGAGSEFGQRYYIDNGNHYISFYDNGKLNKATVIQYVGN